jgi:aspartate-semialdehyde dehydrogenase
MSVMRVAVVGATGQVGTVMRAILAERSFPLDELRLFASSRSAGRRLPFRGEELVVEDAGTADVSGIDIALFSSGATASRELAPRFVGGGAVVIDNSSAWRMDPDVPLVVPEVNAAALAAIPRGIVANPNCTTMVAMPVLKPLHDAAGLRRLVVATYQAVSGSGLAGVAELEGQLRKTADRCCRAHLRRRQPWTSHRLPPSPTPIAHNVIPVAGLPCSATAPVRPSEEQKFRDESQEDPGASRPSSVTVHLCPRPRVHRPLTVHRGRVRVGISAPEEAVRLLAGAPGVELSDVPTPLRAAGSDPSLVGRIRVADGADHGLALFVSGDNLRKGAALNAVQIAEALVSLGIVA